MTSLPCPSTALILVDLQKGIVSMPVAPRSGAFHGTELDLQLRRRGITTVVVAGIATKLGVESTARAACEYGYAVVLAENATAGLSAEAHAFAFREIFPRLGRAKTSDAIVLTR